MRYLQEEYKKSSFYKLRGELKMVLSDSQYGNLEGLKIIASQQQTKDKTNGKI